MNARIPWRQDDMPDIDPQALTPEDIAITRALGGSPDALSLLRAHVEETAGEHRPQQEEMTVAVSKAIRANYSLLVQAGTGTGKSLAYCYAVAASGRRAVIATATNQLSEQLVTKDLPSVERILDITGQSMSFAVLKGRNNYACKARISELKDLDRRATRRASLSQDSLFDVEPNQTIVPAASPAHKKEIRELNDILDWVNNTETGDRSEGPPVSDRTWSQVSVSQFDCVGRACPFYEDCFTEHARRKARGVDIVVTNHALLAQDVKAALSGIDENDPSGASLLAGSIFGNHEVLVIDEAHAFADSLTSALSRDLDLNTVDKFLRKAGVHFTTGHRDKGEKIVMDNVVDTLHELEEVLLSLPTGPLLEMPAEALDVLNRFAGDMLNIHRFLLDASARAVKGNKPKRSSSINKLAEQCEELAATIAAAKSLGPNMVRWVDPGSEGFRPSVRVAPINVGDAFRTALEARVFIGTSATLSIGGDFTPLARALGLEHSASLDVGTPFDYRKQGMMYVPEHPPFPVPVGRERYEHKEAVLKELEHLVHAAGGRTLALFTTTAEAQRAALHLRRRFPMLTVLSHGDAPADALVREFKAEETSVLCATMGLWQGVSIEGASCSLVVIDKISFAPVDDVLTAARRAYVDNQGRDGFSEVIVAKAAISLAQGAGRLIRQADDRGVVAILDPRIRTKAYGRTLLASLPDFPRYGDREIVASALRRLTGGLDESYSVHSRGRGVGKANAESKTARKTPRRAGATRKIGSRPFSAKKKPPGQ